MKRELTHGSPFSGAEGSGSGAADGIQRNFKLRQLEYGLSLKDGLILK